ncbi:hypothetical protein [Legionella sp. CNM-4043-24]|uniref:hypothetical protein n=1 Tax=Legionella sp. CNM-4043-24 TaxID=3421646 RepID=UPI00403A8C29
MKQMLSCVISFYTSLLFAAPPAEVISSCVNNHAVSPTVTIDALEQPRLIEMPETGCEDHYENSIDNLTYGGIFCNDYGYITLNNQRIKLSDAVNYSVNPAMKPGEKGDKLDLWARWFKIDFSNNTWLCIVSAPSSGDGGSEAEYYIVENPYSSSPILNYHFFKDDLIPAGSYTD